MAIFGKSKLREIFEQAEIEVSKDVLNRICDLHTESLDGLNDTVKDLKQSLADAERERDDYKAKAPKDGEETVPKSDYDKIKREYDDYKAGIDAEKTHTAKEHAYRELLKAAGVSDKRISAVVKVTDIDGIELDKDGKIKDAEERANNIKTEWADFIETTTTKGANTANPPANNGKGNGKTKEEILAIKDGTIRRQEMAANPHLFGLEQK